MKSLANDLLDFAQLENGKFRKKEAWFNVHNCIDEVVSIQEYKAKVKKINIVTKFSLEEGYIYSDEERILQVVLNLLSNALKFTDQDGTITISCKCDNEFVTISVEDNGIGISEED